MAPNRVANRKQLVNSDMAASEIDGPKAVMRKFSGRRRDPPFLDEALAGQQGGPEKSIRRAPYRRMMSFPGRKSSPVPQTPNPDSSMTSGQINLDFLHHLAVFPDTPRTSVASGDEVVVSNLEPATKALKLMVCVSRNKECLSTLVSYLCLPKFMDKSVTVDLHVIVYVIFNRTPH